MAFVKNLSIKAFVFNDVSIRITEQNNVMMLADIPNIERSFTQNAS